MEPSSGRAQIEGLAERIEAFAAGLDDDERDLFGYLLDAARDESAKGRGDWKADGYSSPVAALLASVLSPIKVHPGFSIRFFPWIRHKSPVFDGMVVKPSN
jgi:hypothetical protein